MASWLTQKINQLYYYHFYASNQYPFFETAASMDSVTQETHYEKHWRLSKNMCVWCRLPQWVSLQSEGAWQWSCTLSLYCITTHDPSGSNPNDQPHDPHEFPSKSMSSCGRSHKMVVIMHPHTVPAQIAVMLN